MGSLLLFSKYKQKLPFSHNFDPHSSLTLFFSGEGVKMRDKMEISAYILKIVEKDTFLRLPMRAKEYFNRHQLFPSVREILAF